MRKFKFAINGSDYNVEIIETQNNEIHLEVNGTFYQVVMEKEVKASKTPILVRAEVPPPTVKEKKIQKTPTITQNITVKAPLPGVILSIDVKDGDEVKMGQKLLTMEAMKMANNVMAEKDGTIRSIKIKTGDSVLQGDVLMVIE